MVQKLKLRKLYEKKLKGSQGQDELQIKREILKINNKLQEAAEEEERKLGKLT